MQFQTYEKYKPSEIDWLGDIPKDWQIKRLKDFGRGIIGMVYSPIDIVDSDREGMLVLRSSNIQNGKISFFDNVYINKRIPQRMTTRCGDILICSRNGSRALIGKNICINKDSEGYTFGAFMTIFRSKSSKFLSFFFNSQLFDYQSGAFMTSTINQLTIGTLHDLVVVAPIIKNDQIAIGNYLKDRTALVDKKIELLDNKKIKYTELKQNLINEVVTKGLNKKVEMKNSGIEWVGLIPKRWEVKRLKDLGIVSTSSIDKKVVDEEDLIKLVNYIDVYNNPKKEIKNSEDYMMVSANKKQVFGKNLKMGDVLFTPSSETMEDIGVSAVVMEDLKNTLYSYHILRLRFSVKVNNYFKKYLFNNFFVQYYFSKSAKGTTRQILGLSTFDNLKVFVPVDEKEQIAIANYLDEKTGKIDKIINTIDKNIKVLQEFRKTLINDVVTGKVKAI